MADIAHLRTALDWHDQASCLTEDPELFHAVNIDSIRDAKRICAGCDVLTECLNWALDTHEPYGVWGGKTDKERRKLARTKTARHLGPCEDCDRPRYSPRYPGQLLPEGGVWNGRNHSKGRKLCEECRTARQNPPQETP